MSKAIQRIFVALSCLAITSCGGVFNRNPNAKVPWQPNGSNGAAAAQQQNSAAAVSPASPATPQSQRASSQCDYSTRQLFYDVGSVQILDLKPNQTTATTLDNVTYNVSLVATTNQGDIFITEGLVRYIEANRSKNFNLRLLNGLSEKVAIGAMAEGQSQSWYTDLRFDCSQAGNNVALPQSIAIDTFAPDSVSQLLAANGGMGR